MLEVTLPIMTAIISRSFLAFWLGCLSHYWSDCFLYEPSRSRSVRSSTRRLSDGCGLPWSQSGATVAIDGRWWSIDRGRYCSSTVGRRITPSALASSCIQGEYFTTTRSDCRYTFLVFAFSWLVVRKCVRISSCSRNCLVHYPNPK